MKKTAIALLLALFGFAAMASVQAAPYITGAYVDTDLEVDAPFNQAFDDDANGFMLGFGWQTSKPWLAVELTYTDFGDSSKSLTDNYSVWIYDVSETFQNSYEGKAADLWLVGRFSPVSITKNRSLNIVPRVGITAASSRATINHTETVSVEGEVIGTDSGSYTASDSGIGYAYGIGLEVANVLPGVDVFLDYRKHEVEMVYAGQVVDFDPSTYQLGINYHF